MRPKQLDEAELVRRYADGESERAIAETLNIARDTVRRHLDTAGVLRRTRSAAARERWRRLTIDQRQELTAPAHAAVVGCRRTEEHLTRAARSRELRSAGRTPPTAVAMLTRAFQARGMVTRLGHAIGRYNGDLVVGGVVVETLGHSRGASKRSGVRLRYLMDRGYTVIFLWTDDRYTVPLAPAALQLIVRAVDSARRHPSAVPTFMVLRHNGLILDHGVRVNAEFARVRGPRSYSG
jgi:DNA-binding CsgD family transcriptional regulator